MKTFNVLSTAILFVSSMAASSAALAETQQKVWVARLTGATQCEERIVRQSNLGEAIADLESNGNVIVEQAMITKLKGQLFCQSCDCPDGNFFVAKVTLTHANGGETAPQGWNVIPASQINRPKNSEQAGDAKIQPVIPTF